MSERARCPICAVADVRLTFPAQRFVTHDRGFRGRQHKAPRAADRVCKASGHTVEEATTMARRDRIHAYPASSVVVTFDGKPVTGAIAGELITVEKKR